jgi:ABC-type antimicrobial peptide transport system permease subunit
VASLSTVRLVHREKEIAIRSALGTSSRRIVRQLLTEAYLRAGIGFVAGRIVARLALHVLIAMGPTDLPRLVYVPYSFFACYLPARRAATVDPMVAPRHE